MTWASEFQWAPTLGGECYPTSIWGSLRGIKEKFQWAPTLGGECYLADYERDARVRPFMFQWAPTLGGECYTRFEHHTPTDPVNILVSMGTHPWG